MPGEKMKQKSLNIMKGNSGKIILAAFILIQICNCLYSGEIKPIRLLIISGKGNHEWQKTTPYLKQVFEESGFFSPDVTERPDTLKAKDLKKYNAIVSNWNAFPESSRQWGGEAEKAIIDFVRNGGGFVLFHAASATHYDWAEYQEMVGSTWGKNTHHVSIEPFEVKISSTTHPVTEGLSNFWITDELWVDMDQKPGNQILSSAFAPKDNKGSDKDEPVVICRNFGNGRCFYNVLGHDVAAMKNPGWKTLMVRGTEWAANGTVTIPIPEELMKKPVGLKNNFSWKKDLNSVALLNQGKVVWQYNFNKDEGKPYFHPLSLNNGTVLTWLRPKDHIWHRALWFSWKFINGVNYWEEDPKTGQPDGISEIVKVKTVNNPDYSADIIIDLAYHPPQGKTVLKEKRTVHVSCPDANGNYFLDWAADFTAEGQQVILDRTPIPGESGGQSYGGYAGFSIRMSPNLWNVQLLNSNNDSLSLHGKKANWLDIKARTLQGENIQIVMMGNPKNLNSPEPWWISNDTKIPFYYFSPAPLFYGSLVMAPSQQLRLHYRLFVQSMELTEDQIEKQYKLFIENK
ncbi:MAG: PmoA family protein [Bacteroidia bacterium]|nr:PmoA family protein [Bacteroidia bacterium]